MTNDNFNDKREILIELIDLKKKLIDFGKKIPKNTIKN